MKDSESRRGFIKKVGFFLLGIWSFALTGFRKVTNAPEITLASEGEKVAVRPCGPCSPPPGRPGPPCGPCAPPPGRPGCAPCLPCPPSCAPCYPTCAPCHPTCNPHCAPCAPTCAPPGVACFPCAPYCGPTCSPYCSPYCHPTCPPSGTCVMITVSVQLIEVQRHLQRKGYYNGPIDGNWNPDTWGAIVEFKRANGLRPDGIIDATTWSVLSS